MNSYRACEGRCVIRGRRRIILLPCLALAAIIGCAPHTSDTATGSVSRDGASSLQDGSSVRLPSLIGLERVAAEREAHEAETQALQRAATEDLVITRDEWVFGSDDGVLLITPNYRIHTTMRGSGFLDMLPEFMEEAVQHYTSALGGLPLPRESMNTYLFQRRNQWEDKTRELLPRQADTYLKLGRGGYSTRGNAVLYYIDRSGYQDTLAIAVHEGWHQYTQTVFAEQLPIWLEEGIAAYMEGFQRSRRTGTYSFAPWSNRERYYALRNAVRRDRLIPLRELLDRSPQSFLDDRRDGLLTYYGQAWALVHFLAEGEDGAYREGLHQALLDAADGSMVDHIITQTNLTSRRRRSMIAANRTGPWLIYAYFTKDLDTFETQYENFVRTITSDEHRREIRRGRSPVAESN